MGFREWPRWLKYGIILSVVGFIPGLFCVFNSGNNMLIICIPASLLFLPASFLKFVIVPLFDLVHSSSISTSMQIKLINLIQVIFGTIILFFVGSLIGLIRDKHKLREENSKINKNIQVK